jgi:SOS regulatory protein LexA
MDSTTKDILISFYEREKRMPTYTEMMRLFGYKSKNAVARLVTKLVAAGIVAQDRLGRLIPTDSFTDLPLAGLVKAGLPSSVDELSDTINIESYLAPKRGSTFMLEVDGDSMIDAHIANGDMVLAERTNTARDGDIVIAEIDGEFTMKYLKKKGNVSWLEPANKAFKPMYPTQSLTICAVVKAVIRKY